MEERHPFLTLVSHLVPRGLQGNFNRIDNGWALRVENSITTEQRKQHDVCWQESLEGTFARHLPRGDHGVWDMAREGCFSLAAQSVLSAVPTPTQQALAAQTGASVFEPQHPDWFGSASFTLTLGRADAKPLEAYATDGLPHGTSHRAANFTLPQLLAG